MVPNYNILVTAEGGPNANTVYKLGANGQYVQNQTISLPVASITVSLSDDGLWLISGIGNGYIYVLYNNGSQFNSVQNITCCIGVFSSKISSNGSLFIAGCQESTYVSGVYIYKLIDNTFTLNQTISLTSTGSTIVYDLWLIKD